MYEIHTTSGLCFTCDEFADAVVLADDLAGDLSETVVVRRASDGEVVYETGK